MTSELAPRQLVRRPSQVVADELRAMILHGDLSDVESLPEQEIAVRLGVSRHHLREALRLLEQDGLVRVRPGRNGGVFPAVPGVDVLARTFAGILGANATSLRDLMAARLVIEPAVAEIAATAASDDDLAGIEAILTRQAEQGRYEYRLNSQFHIAIAAAAHNQTLLLMMRSIERIIHTIDTLDVSQFSADAGVTGEDLRQGSYRAHRAILRALRARDPSGVADLMRRHLLGFEQRLGDIGWDPARHTVADVLQAAHRTGGPPRDGRR